MLAPVLTQALTTPHALAALDLRANGLALGALRLAAAATADALPGEFSGASTALRAKGLLPPPPTAARGAGEGARLMLPAVAAPPAGLAAWVSSKAGPGTGVIAPCCKSRGVDRAERLLLSTRAALARQPSRQEGGHATETRHNPNHAAAQPPPALPLPHNNSSPAGRQHAPASTSAAANPNS